jgi:hypothetical protein
MIRHTYIQIILFIGGVLFIACQRPEDERNLRSIRASGLAVKIYNGVQPSHEMVMQTMISEVNKVCWQYDSIYVTCLPHRIEREQNIYTITGRTFYVFHYFSPKRNSGDETHIIYDPQGDLQKKYIDFGLHYHLSQK